MAVEQTADDLLAGQMVDDALAEVTVRNLLGVVIATVTPVPDSLLALKEAIEQQVGMSVGLQKLVKYGDTHAYADGDTLGFESLDIMLVMDEENLYTWDIEGNPCAEQLQGNGGILTCPGLRTDYVNVLTKEPLRDGIHYFEFVMHYIGDEQACGLVKDPSQAGSRHSLRSLKAWAYYPGRMGSSGGSLRDGKGSLHALGRAVKEFKKLTKEGDIIGMLVDFERGAVAFDLNGELQGACEIPKEPLWVITHVDTENDHVELRKLDLEKTPPANLDALQGALLNISEGQKLNYYSSETSE